jgi:DNA repair protein RadD
MIRVGENYKKWLVFAIDINHAEHIAEALIRSGIPANVVHSKMEQNRDVVIRDYKSGKYRCLVNVGILTTGFDDPSIDLIGLLRPTQSPVLHVQTIGRGMRKFHGKDHCAVIDFAGNTKRLGPVNSITVKEKGKGTGGEPITKTCPNCDTIHHPSVRICKWCNYKFQFKHGLSGSDGGAIIARKTNWKKVDKVTYEIHKKPYRPDSLKVLYHCGLDVYSDYVFLDSRGYAKFKANHWINYRGGKADSVDEALGESEIYKIPNRILVDTSAKYPIISDYSF